MPTWAPPCHDAHASCTVVRFGGRSAPLVAAVIASARHDFAAASAGKVLRTFEAAGLKQ